MQFFSNNMCYDGDMIRNAEELTRRCHGYFLENGDKNFCFNDLQKYAEKLPFWQVDKLMQLISQNINEHEIDNSPEGPNRVSWPLATATTAVLIALTVTSEEHNHDESQQAQT